NQNINLLVVDDDVEIRNLLSAYLVKNGYGFVAIADGKSMFSILATHAIDLIILDLMLPGEDGLSLCRKLRTSSNQPVIMLTARGEDTDRIIGLEMGADDYLAKPFNPRELEARIKAVLRRVQAIEPDHIDMGQSDALYFGEWTLNGRSRELVDENNLVHPLSAAEYDLLLVFLKHAGRILSRDQLMDLTKGRDSMPFDRSVDMQVSRLRKRLGESAEFPEYIKTVRGQGYLFIPRVRR
ncbi:MAG: two-component system OmpR family response regulator, partial [Gammaproteobacteria bacterium]